MFIQMFTSRGYTANDIRKVTYISFMISLLESAIIKFQYNAPCLFLCAPVYLVWGSDKHPIWCIFCVYKCIASLTRVRFRFNNNNMLGGFLLCIVNYRINLPGFHPYKFFLVRMICFSIVPKGSSMLVKGVLAWFSYRVAKNLMVGVPLTKNGHHPLVSIY